ncbi:5-formyltetrahydrofolate cyclo-ligase [Halobacillus shinanisalinarum]|uniref:5-formyltetrahydrofolate cyclo-ligase n=1 Tax=Halobacillus shinanisalinarum TaxID=2932258 RepID=A0ABY4H082_9BACI|nr:5-formyltetrahydrofolate cyclo-ligase [Halobacillus shinanisalinarum]UOQ93739.1 5-formyltetrahydrofolate cyclo-ligase [Halobacillus shinanisalinarum]
MEKKEWRTRGKALLRSFSALEKGRIEESIHNQLFLSELWDRARVVAVTVSLPDEWSTKPIIEQAWAEGKKLVVPKCDPKSKTLTFYSLKSYDQLESVYFGLQEPNPAIAEAVSKEEIELLVVPGLIFDHKGFRIGFGGGFYDRFLTDFNGITVSLISKKQLTTQLPSEVFDIPVQHIITEKKWLIM